MHNESKTTEILNDIDRKFPNFRSNKRWNCPVYGYDSVTDFSTNAKALDGIHTIFDGGLPIDMHLTIEKGSPLVVFLNARSSERTETYRLPSFVGFGVVPARGVSVLRINDPVLYTSRSLRIGWYAGARGEPLLMKLNSAIATVIDLTCASKVIFVGGSAGGFASLNLSRFVRDSLAVVWNPQTDLLKFAKNEVLEFTSSAYGIDNFETCERLLPALTVSTVQNHYKFNLMRNYVLYMQNVDDWHTRDHCKPFLDCTGRHVAGQIRTGKFDDRFFLYAADWGKGHASPPTSFLKSLLQSLISESVEFDDELFSERMNKLLVVAEDAT